MTLLTKFMITSTESWVHIPRLVSSFDMDNLQLPYSIFVASYKFLISKSKGNSVTLEKYCNEKCTLSARSFKRAGSSFQSQGKKLFCSTLVHRESLASFLCGSDCAYIRSQRSRGKDDGNYAHNHRQGKWSSMSYTLGKMCAFDGLSLMAVQDKRNLQSEQQERHDALGARPPVDNATNGRMGMESQRYRKMKSTQNIL